MSSAELWCTGSVATQGHVPCGTVQRRAGCEARQGPNGAPKEMDWLTNCRDERRPLQFVSQSEKLQVFSIRFLPESLSPSARVGNVFGPSVLICHRPAAGGGQAGKADDACSAAHSEAVADLQ